MEISLEHANSAIRIQSYQDGVITLNNEAYKCSLALNSEQLLHIELPETAKELSIEQLNQLEFNSYEVAILGTGNTLIFPEWELLESAQCSGRPLEVMATDAACRTFTALAEEGRKVLAILFT